MNMKIEVDDMHFWSLLEAIYRANSNQENNTCVVDKPYDEFIEVVKTIFYSSL